MFPSNLEQTVEWQDRGVTQDRKFAKQAPKADWLFRIPEGGRSDSLIPFK